MMSKRLKDRTSSCWQNKILHSAIFRLYRKFQRLYQWNKLLWNDYDFDAHSIYSLLEHKLKNINHQLITGHAIQEKKDLQALSIAISLAARLREDKYKDITLNRHDKKWGELITWTTPLPNGNFSWNSRRPNAVFEVQKIQERTELLAAWESAKNRRDREAKWLFSILATRIPTWWD